MAMPPLQPFPPMPPAKPPYKDKPLIGSIAMMLLSAASIYFGIPLSDDGIQGIMELLGEGVLAISGIFAAVRALILRKRSSA